MIQEHMFHGKFSDLFPILDQKIGTGIRAIVMNPSNELPHPKPKEAYIWGPTSGRNTPPIERRSPPAAIAEAE